ncbi:urease accessory protein UreE [Shinella curvata]|uniref:Urease accessory protein UreE n=1 Tax=Shinella curvata TaxID=1817964 RepID=A0ABT8XD33_9HYPH|nr:urease accessory protein UreE [Shinella curvata]MCJ8055231.1 urease accessory protein UreE [Shinella curvata]MDO6121648.1 urease accessory protein UreE [Shinella curvata]
MPYRSTQILSHGAGADRSPIDVVVLAHDQRHVRRKLLHMQHDDVVMLDLKEPVQLAHGDLLLTETGETIEVIAAEELLYEVMPRDRLHLVELAWHLGNRHLPAQIEEARILILRDHVIKDMLIGLGAGVRDVSEPFHPVRGAYHGSGHGHDHGHHHHSHG